MCIGKEGFCGIACRMIDKEIKSETNKKKIRF